jgi:hypothetical protein
MFRLYGRHELSGPFDGDINLLVIANDIVGSADSIEWTFTLGSKESVVKSIELLVFVTAAPADDDPKHLHFAQIFTWACGWAHGLKASDREGILDALLKNRANAGLMFSYARDSADGLHAFIQVGKGECGEVAEWFVALASVHGIKGKVMWLALASLEDDVSRGWRWRQMVITTHGLNNPDFDEWDQQVVAPVVRKGAYQTDATPGEALLYDEEPIKSRIYWPFSRHQVAYFEELGLVYDGSMEGPGEKFPPPEPGLYDYPPGHGFREGYLKRLFSYLLGRIYLEHGTLVEVYVDAEDVYAQNELLRFEFVAK